MRSFRRATAAEPSLYEGRIGAAEVSVVLTGIGPQHARRALQIALVDGADACISTGLAGALQPCHRIGDVLVARTVRAPFGADFVKSDAELLRAAAASGAQEVSAFQSSEHAVLTAKEKGRLACSADAIEMESFVILSEAGGLCVPAVAIRAIGDVAGQDLPLDFNRTVGPKGQISIARVLGQLARNPHRVPGLIRLGRDSQKAATRLAAFLEHFIESLAAARRTEGVHEEVAAG